MAHAQGDVAQLVGLGERTGVPEMARRLLARLDGDDPILVDFLAAPVPVAAASDTAPSVCPRNGPRPAGRLPLVPIQITPSDRPPVPG